MPSCLRLFMQVIRLADSRAFCSAGSNIAARIEMRATTTRSSINVKQRTDSTFNIQRPTLHFQVGILFIRNDGPFHRTCWRLDVEWGCSSNSSLEKQQATQAQQRARRWFGTPIPEPSACGLQGHPTHPSTHHALG